MQAILASPLLLRHVLLADAAMSGTTAVLLMAAASPLAPLLGLPADFLFEVGLMLVPFAASVFLVARGKPVSRPFAAAIAAVNALWVAGSIVFLLVDWLEPSALGVAFVLVQALVVALFAELQYTGLRRAAA